VYFLVDHRTYVNAKGEKRSDSMKRWIPAPALAGLMNNAIQTLCENLRKDRDQIDLTEYKLKISKTGTGRGSAWALSFNINRSPVSADVKERVGKFFGDEHGRLPTLSRYRDFIQRMFQPDPRYMISKGGSYTKPPKATRETSGSSEDDEPPF
jgi:hypothetical protein